jgi:hypothetical protein
LGKLGNLVIGDAGTHIGKPGYGSMSLSLQV